MKSLCDITVNQLLLVKANMDFWPYFPLPKSRIYFNPKQTWVNVPCPFEWFHTTCNDTLQRRAECHHLAEEERFLIRLCLQGKDWRIFEPAEKITGNQLLQRRRQNNAWRVSSQKGKKIPSPLFGVRQWKCFDKVIFS